MPKKKGDEDDWDASGSEVESDFEEEMRQQNKSAKRQKTNEKFQGPDTDDDRDDDDDLFETEEERARVMNLPELQREMLLTELTEARQRKRERKRLLQQAAAAEAQRGPLKSTREVREEAAKKSAMQELKAARERKAKGEKPSAAKKKTKKKEEYYEDEEEEEEEDGEEGMLAEEYVVNEDDEDDDDILDRMRRAQKSAWYEEEDEEATLEELRSIQIKRGELQKWLGEPHFYKTVPGCLVRVRAPDKKGPDGKPRLDEQGRPKVYYFLAQAVNIEKRPPGSYKDTGIAWPCPYPFGPKNEKTDLWLVISRGGSERKYPLQLVSDTDFTDDEFESWLEINRQKNLMLMRREVQEVKERLDKAHNYIYTSEDVRAVIEERKKKGLAPVNYALEKARLERELDHAVEQGNAEHAEQLRAALDQLVENMKRQGAGSSLGGGAGGGMSALNKRNKEKNFQTDFIKPSEDGGTGGKAAAGTTLDPFSRRATRSRVYWNTKKTAGDGGGQGNEVLNEGEEQDGDGDGDMKETAAEQGVNHEELAAVVDLSGLDMSFITTANGSNRSGTSLASSLIKNILGGRKQNGSGVRVGGARPLTLREYKAHRGIA